MYSYIHQYSHHIVLYTSLVSEWVCSSHYNVAGDDGTSNAHQFSLQDLRGHDTSYMYKGATFHLQILQGASGGILAIVYTYVYSVYVYMYMLYIPLASLGMK